MSRMRKHFRVQGIVQGVGFRPFVFRIAVQENLKGWVTNSTQGVEIEVEGAEEAVLRFERRLREEAPAASNIVSVQSLPMPCEKDEEFQIRASLEGAGMETLISPDISVCDACLREMEDPEDRRYRYPFINCTDCGPRYTIIQDIPYDRSKTTMSVFERS